MVQCRAAWLSLVPFVFALTTFWSCAEPDNLTDARCVTPCYPGPPGTLGEGLCRVGVPVCDADGEFVLDCVGAVVPTVEICNGLDDDCDGRVDEGAEGIGAACVSPENVNHEMFGRSRCRPGENTCDSGALVCTNEVLPAGETCNGIDDNCDGLVDEGLGLLGLCYSGDLGELVGARSICRAGLRSCVAGQEVCVGEQRPQTEICNGVDDDCDGLVDDVVGTSTAVPIDVMLLVDTSGSMAGHITELRAALLATLPQFSSSLYRYGLVHVPSMTHDVPDFIANLQKAEEIEPFISALQIGNSSIEASYDAAVACIDGTWPISWRTNAVRIIVFFGDEEGQSSHGLTERETARILADAGVRFFVFTQLAVEYTRSYDDIVSATNGDLFDLTSPSNTLSRILTTVFQTTCGP